jgi:hypothetical protein
MKVLLSAAAHAERDFLKVNFLYFCILFFVFLIFVFVFCLFLSICTSVCKSKDV